MKFSSRWLGVSTAALMLAAGVVTIHFVARAGEPTPGIHVDNIPLNRDPQSGNSYSPVVKKVAPSVVNIYSSRIVKQRLYRNPLLADPFFSQFFGEAEGGSREITSRDNWLGSGMIVSPDGYILTANHVVEGADEIKVGIQNDKTVYSAKVIGLDQPTDVAILKIEAKNLPAVSLGDSDQLEVGDVVLAIGNPFGIGQTVTRGIISALGRSITDASDNSPYPRQYQNFIQTDAAINQGNSGGALVDAQGRLIGINDAMISPSGTSAGIGLAVPVNMARNVMEGFLKNGRVVRGQLGVDLQDVSAALARYFNAPDTEGALVTFVGPDTPAARAGLQSGDIIVGLNEKTARSADVLRVLISELHPGIKANINIIRNGIPQTLIVTPGERTDGSLEVETVKSDYSTHQPAKADALDGVEVQDLTPRLRWQLKMPDDVTGALIVRVDNASNAYEGGLRTGDVILEINRQPVASAGVAVELCKAARSEQIVVKIWQPTRGGGGVTRYLSVDNTKRAQ